jgi:hypothetical protein
MANKTYSDSTATYGSATISYAGGTAMSTICVFRYENNLLTAVSGADTGTYKIVDNFTDIVIEGVTHSRCPFDRRIAKNNSDGTITVEVV